jgi:hypothetical protein|tara:strand:+ start:1461 stop:1751 length:291 start_codon:yes stop_codon:yes gene_type:complete
MKRKCKTCGRTVGQYAYGGGKYSLTFEQRVGKTSKDRWLQATSRFNSEYREDEKKVVWDFPNNPNSHGLFCRAMCMEAYLEQMNETIDRLPNLINV